MNKGNMSPELVNKTEKMSVPATKCGPMDMCKEGKTEYPRGAATSNPRTKEMTPKLTHGK